MKNLVENFLFCALGSVLVVAFSNVMAAAQAPTPARAAMIRSEAFTDEKAGITRLVKAQAQLASEFKPRQEELAQISSKINKLRKEIADLEAELPSLDPAGKLAQQAIIDTKKSLAQSSEAKGKILQQASQSSYDLRQQLDIAPIFEDITKAIEAYAKGHNIDVVIDASTAKGVYVFNTPPDVTAAFIADYNAKHPA